MNWQIVDALLDLNTKNVGDGRVALIAKEFPRDAIKSNADELVSTLNAQIKAIREAPVRHLSEAHQDYLGLREWVRDGDARISRLESIIANIQKVIDVGGY
ncbi:MAG: hypothetical protein WEB52_14455 [Dehalococcoidia bacterium]